MKKRLKMLGIFGLVLSFGLCGCGKQGGNQEDLINKDPIELLKAIVDDPDAEKDYQWVEHDFGTCLYLNSDENGKLALRECIDSAPTYDIKKIGNKAYWVFTSSTEYEDAADEIIIQTKQDNDENMVILENKENPVFFRYNDFCDDMTGPLLSTIKNFLNNYASYFDVKKEKVGDDMVLTFTCVDLQGYKDKETQLIKENQPDYDPLKLILSVSKKDEVASLMDEEFVDTTVSKNEAVEIKRIFTLDQEGRLVKFETLYKNDYGDNIIKETHAQITINHNAANIDAEKIDSIVKDAANGVYKEGDAVDW